MPPVGRPAGRRWPFGLAAFLGLLLVGGVVAAALGSRQIEGAVPGKAPILGLAVVGDGFLIGTADGVLRSADGRSWEPVDGFEGESLVASGGASAVVLSGGELYRSDGTSGFVRYARDLGRAGGLALTSDGTAYLGRPGGDLQVIDAGGSAVPLQVDEPPEELLALSAGDTDPPLLVAGGLSGGLWRSIDGGRRWERILGTPVRAGLVDRAHPGRLMIGTAGGLLVATPTDPWEFTDLRVPVEALAQTDAGYWAITADRLLYRSADGVQWSAAAQED